jgi:toxin ParE1/3/4
VAGVFFRKLARADLDDIADYIALDNPDRALSFLDQLEHAALSLAKHPDRGPLAPEAGKDVHRLTVSNYNIYYRHDGTKVIVLRILHGARDIGGLI